MAKTESTVITALIENVRNPQPPQTADEEDDHLTPPLAKLPTMASPNFRPDGRQELSPLPRSRAAASTHAIPPTPPARGSTKRMATVSQPPPLPTGARSTRPLSVPPPAPAQGRRPDHQPSQQPAVGSSTLTNNPLALPSRPVHASSMLRANGSQQLPQLRAPLSLARYPSLASVEGTQAIRQVRPRSWLTIAIPLTLFAVGAGFAVGRVLFERPAVDPAGDESAKVAAPTPVAEADVAPQPSPLVDVTFFTQPTGARVELVETTGISLVGNAPVLASMPVGQELEVRVSLEGFVTKTQRITATAGAITIDLSRDSQAPSPRR